MTEQPVVATEPEQVTEQQLTVRTLLEAGVHIGHPTKRWHPKMAPYIYQKRQKIHIRGWKCELPWFRYDNPFTFPTAYVDFQTAIPGSHVRPCSGRSEEAVIGTRWHGCQ